MRVKWSVIDFKCRMTSNYNIWLVLFFLQCARVPVVAIAEDRVSSEEEFTTNTKDDRSPVDLTSRRLLETNTAFDRQSSESITDESTLDSCKNDRVPNHTRRLAFSVENILDPNKFTGKHVDDSLKDRILQPFNWRPHLDFIDNSPIDASRPGKYKNLNIARRHYTKCLYLYLRS